MTIFDLETRRSVGEGPIDLNRNMVYSQERLEKAITAVKAEKARLQRAKDEQYARTHYRDDFTFRHTAKDLLLIPTIRTNYSDGSDTEDADYHPEIKRMSRIHRQRILGVNNERKSRRVKRDPNRGCKEVVCASPSSSFITLRLQHSLTAEMKKKLAARLQTSLKPSWLRPWVTGREIEWKPLRTTTDNSNVSGEYTPRCTRRVATDLLMSGLSLNTDLSTKPRGSLRSGRVREAIPQKQYLDERVGYNENHIPKEDYPITTVNVQPGNPYQTKLTREAHDLKQSKAHSNESVCTAHTTPTLPSGRSAQDAIVVEDSDDEDSDTQESQLDFRNGGMVTIVTSFAHPIAFGSTRQYCDFCQDYRFGIIGYGKRSVTVTRNPTNPLQYLELNNGHAESNHPTSMCSKCIQARMSIIRCHKHTVVRLDDMLKKNGINYTAYARELTCRDQRSKSHSAHVKHICSICPRPAFFHCQALHTEEERCNQPPDSHLVTETQSEGRWLEGNSLRQGVFNAQSRSAVSIYGCGLLLCENCRKALSSRGGRLDSKVVQAVNKTAYGARADVGFLLREGALWQSCNNQVDFGGSFEKH